MNYKHHYSKLIERSKERGLNKRKLDYYVEKHHIMPACLYGWNKH
jgi:aspartyl/asparaginyl-tRNA synthetase